MIFTTTYDISESPWWTPSLANAPAVADLLADLTNLHEKVHRAATDPHLEQFLKGFVSYHSFLYPREVQIGEDIGERETTIHYLEKIFASDNIRLAVKVRNLRGLISTIFPDPIPAPSTTIDGLEFTSAMLRDWHSAIGRDAIPDAGQYRTKMLAPAQENYVYLIPQKVATELDKLCAYVRDKFPEHQTPLARIKLAATFLANFLHIHPFSKGNGRVGRLAVSWILKGISIVPIPLYCGVPSREDYLNCLRVSRERAPFAPSALARMILEAVVQVHRNVCFSLDL